MQDWSEGYVTEIGYTHGYYPELNPVRARLALLASSIVPPDTQVACELGFGQGVSVNIHAAAGTAQWYGTDFNPAHAGFARELAGQGELAGRLHDDAFEAFCRRTDLPDFDFIGLHGIWSWISDANRAILADFLRRKLKVGGVVYVSYNTQPGWGAIAPLRDLLTGHADALSPGGADTAGRVDAALDFADRLLASGAGYGRANPGVAEYLKSLRKHNHQYLAHEYFNENWMPMPFSRMASCMEAQKLQFAGSASLIEHVPEVNFTSDQRKILDEIPDARFRETIRDFMLNQRFRRDYWVRGVRRLTPFELAERVRAQHVVLAALPETVDLKIQGALGEAALHAGVYQPIIDQLAERPYCTLGELEQAIARHKVTLGQLLQAILVLTAKGAVHPAQEPAQAEQARAAATQLNTRLCRMARYGEDIGMLASPVTGGGIPVGRLEKLFLLARGQGMTAPEQWAQLAYATLAAQNQRLMKDGTAIDKPEDQLAELERQAREFAGRRLSMLEALGVSA